MKSATLALLLLALLSSFALAQHLDTLWTHTYIACFPDLPQANSLQLTHDGGFVIAVDNIVVNHWIYDRSGVLKTNAQGEMQWATCDGSSPFPYSYANDACERNDGSFIAVGNLRAQGMEYIWKLSPSGSIDWNRSWGVVPVCVHTLADGGFIMCGSGDYSVSRADSMGNPIWSRPLTADMKAIAVINGGFIAAGSTNAQGAGGWDLYLVRLNDSGDTLWTRTYGTEMDENLNSFCVLPDGGYVLVGSYGSWTATAHTYSVRTNDAGDSLWTRRLPLASIDVPVDAIPVYNGTIMMLVNLTISDTSRQTMLANLNLSGDTLWTEMVPVSQLVAQRIVQTSDSGFAVLGNIYGGLACLVRYATYRLSVDHPAAPVPDAFQLRVFPNPFNPSTTISFTLPREARARIAVFNILGREVAVLADKMFTSGDHRILFNGSSLPSGLYFARLHSGSLILTTKLLLLK